MSDGTTEIEQALLGSLLLRNDLLPLIAKKITADSFSEPIHQQIYDICEKLISAGKLANPLTIKPLLPEDIELAANVTLSQYIARLMAAGATASEAPHLAVIVRDLADKRLILGVCNELARPGDADPAEIAAWGIEQLDGIVASRSIAQVPALSLGQSLTRAMDAAAKAYQSDGALQGISYGLKDLDRKTDGLHVGELTVLAGRPGSGKTALALNFCRAFCQRGYRGVFFSLEMGDVSLSQRLLSDVMFDEHELSYSRIMSGRFRENEWRYIQDAGRKMEPIGDLLRIEQQSGLTISQISARCRQMKRKGGLDFVVVDHIGHIAASDRYRGNKVAEVGETSGGLLRLSRELDVGVLALSQLNRGLEAREDKRPNLSDLRNSGDLEQDAATVLMVYREAYYLQNREPSAGSAEYDVWQSKMVDCINVLDVLVEKQRSGPVGAVRTFVNVACNAVRDAGWSRTHVKESSPDMDFAF